MGNKSNQDQGETTRITDYERSKLLRVEENQERLRQLGIKKIANSLKSLVDSQKTKKKKKKKKSASISDRDARYSREHNGETGKDYPEEVAATVGAPKKQLRTQYIAPLSMNKYANLAKHRIVAPNVSRVSEESCDGLETFADSNAAKKSRLQQCKEANDQNGQFIDRSAANKNQSRAKVTLGELVLNKKGSQRHSGQNAAKPNSVTTSISSGSRKQLFLVDEEDEDDVRSQGLSLSTK